MAQKTPGKRGYNTLHERMNERQNYALETPGFLREKAPSGLLSHNYLQGYPRSCWLIQD